VVDNNVDDLILQINSFSLFGSCELCLSFRITYDNYFSTDFSLE